MRRMPCRRYKHHDSAHELAMSPLNLSRALSMASNPLASHPDQIAFMSRANAGLHLRRMKRFHVISLYSASATRRLPAKRLRLHTCTVLERFVNIALQASIQISVTFPNRADPLGATIAH